MKKIWSAFTWVIGALLLIGALFWVQNQPPLSPSEMQFGMGFLSLISLPLALYFLWRLKGENFDFSTIWYALRFVATLHFSVFLFCSAFLGWFEPYRTDVVFLVILDTILKGLLFDLIESYELDVSHFEPDDHLFLWQTISFVFRFLYGSATTAVGIRIGQLLRNWRKTRSNPETTPSDENPHPA